MATGGEFGYDDPELDNKLDNKDDDDDSEQEDDTIRPFQAEEASTPYHSGEQHEMQTMQHEQSGLPDTSYKETPLLGAQSEKQKSWDALTSRFPRATATSLETSYSKTGRLQVKIFGVGEKIYNLFSKDANTSQERLNPSLTKVIKISLGESAEEIITEDRDTIQDERQRLEESQKQLSETEAVVVERNKLRDEVNRTFEQNLRNDEQIRILQEENGSKLEIESEINQLKLQKKGLEAEIKENQLSTAGGLVEKQKKLRDKVKKLLQQNAKIDDRLRILEEENGRIDEIDSEILRLKQLNISNQTEIKEKEKMMSSLEKKK